MARSFFVFAGMKSGAKHSGRMPQVLGVEWRESLRHSAR